MAESNRYNFKVGAGATFQAVFRWGGPTLTSKAITAISSAAPVSITAVGHGVPDGWPVAVVSAGGMTQINATRYPPRGNDWRKATVSTVDVITINDVNSADFTPYTSGGFLVYPAPVDLAGMTAVLTIWDSPDHSGTPLVTLAGGTGITLDNTAKTITAKLATAGLTWTLGYFDLDATDSLGGVTQLATGTLVIE